MPSSIATITPAQCQAIHELVRDHLSGIGEVNLAMKIGDYVAAERLGRELEQDHPLLADLGCAEHDDRRTVALTMPRSSGTRPWGGFAPKRPQEFTGSPEEREASRQVAAVAGRCEMGLATATS